MKKQKKNPAEVFGEMRKAKMGIAVGSQLEGGSIKFGRNPKRLFELSEKAKKKSNIAFDEGRFRKSDRLNRKANRLENKAIAKK
tara:strand:+ start:1411 stop:1662 length:252 start_codon:yes stop_codon:yes gene_type:complete